VGHEGPHGERAHRPTTRCHRGQGEHLFATYTAGVIARLEDVTAWDGKSWEMP
jgi:hypothetical protein